MNQYQIIISIGFMLLGSIIVNAFYLGHTLGKIKQCLENINESLDRNFKEHDLIWKRLNQISDKLPVA